jgi:hypothetical protein
VRPLERVLLAVALIALAAIAYCVYLPASVNRSFGVRADRRS